MNTRILASDLFRPGHGLWLALALLLLSGTQTMWVGRCQERSNPRVLCCGAEEVYVLELERGVEPPKKVWTWSAQDSSEIPEEAKKLFASTDECKPCGKFVLITSSSGGVALVSRESKNCVFFTQARNAHSACLLPEYRVAVASSFGGDELLVYGLQSSQEGTPAEPIARMPLVGAHGTVWDSKRNRLWALGDEELLLIEIVGADDQVELKVEKRFDLPSKGGHDLSQTRIEDELYVTTNTSVYRFHKGASEFVPETKLSDQIKVKSITEHPKTGEIVYHQATSTNWWSDTIRFIGDRNEIQLSGQRLYKIRWDVGE